MFWCINGIESCCLNLECGAERVERVGRMESAVKYPPGSYLTLKGDQNVDHLLYGQGMKATLDVESLSSWIID